MGKNELVDFETFNEFPDKYLKVDRNSNYYYIKKASRIYIAKTRINNVSIIDFNNDKKIKVTKSYYDIKNGTFITKTVILYDINGKNKIFVGEEEIYSLSNLLNIKGNDEYYLTQNDINVLINYEKESEKIYAKTSGK